MPKRKLILLFIALMIAVGTTMVAREMMSNKGGQTTTAVAPPATKTMEVLVASKDLPTGSLLNAADIKWQAWPQDDAAVGLMVKGKDSTESMIGAVLRQGLRAGEPFIQGRVVRKNDQGFMAAVLNPGMRAMAVSLTPVGGVAGFVFPGDRVDVLVTHQINRKTDMDPEGHKVSETLLTNVRVLALDQQTSDQMTEPKVAKIATLEVTSKQAEALAVAADMGVISLALRSLAADPNEVPPLTSAGVAVDGTPPVGNVNGDFTWDSDVSNVLQGPNNRKGSIQRVQVLRGKEKTEAVFDSK